MQNWLRCDIRYCTGQWYICKQLADFCVTTISLFYIKIQQTLKLSYVGGQVTDKSPFALSVAYFLIMQAS
jgi:hypothetical protein